MESPTDELLARAFQLAYFIHGNTAIAARITQEAMSRLEAITLAQDKRRYYSATARTKVSLSELHLLQRITYTVSDHYEQEQEQANGESTLDEEDMIIRFIKHLVQITVKRNSFYVTLGLSRLLHTYTTPETMAIHDLVTQDPNCPKDDDYFRECKKKLLQELQARFGQVVNMVRGVRGETRFQSQDNPSQHTDLVRHCLSLFTPWKSPCVVPEHFDPLRDPLRPLSLAGQQADDAHLIEVNRIHSVLHPDCFSRLIRALKFAPPEQRLAVPQFFLANGQDDEPRPPRPRRSPVKLNDEELLAIRTALAEEASRRKSVSAGFLSVVVDGIERAQLELARARRVRLELPAGAELIEVRANDQEGDLLLAANLLTYDDQAGEERATSWIILEGGQKISFAVSFSKNDAGIINGAQVDITYQETDPVRAASLLWRQLKYRISEARWWPGFGASPILRPAVALGLVAALVAGITLYIQWRQEPTTPPALVKQPPTTERRGSPQKPPTTGTPLPGSEPDQSPAPDTEVAANRPPSAGETLLREEAERAAESLLAVKRIYVYSLGDDPFSQQVRDHLISRLPASGRFMVAETVEEADAAFKGSATQVATRTDETSGQEVGVGQVAVRLVNADGEVIWRTPPKSARGKYQGTAADVAAQVVQELLEDIRRLAGKNIDFKKKKSATNDTNSHEQF
jgi:hypothetical protein